MSWVFFDQRQLDIFLCCFEGSKSLHCTSTKKISHVKNAAHFSLKFPCLYSVKHNLIFVCYHTKCVMCNILLPKNPCGDNKKIQSCNYMYYMGLIRLARSTYLHLKQLNPIFSALDNKISIYL